MRQKAIVGLVLCIAVAAFAQQPGATTTTGSTPSGGRGGGNLGRTDPNMNSPFPDQTGLSQRPIFLSGKVVLDDGTALTDRVKIERVCNGMARTEAYTDRKGQFSFQLGRNMELQDASSSSAMPDFMGGNNSRRSNGSAPAGGIEHSLFGCDLRAELTGYRSDVITLANRHYMDDPNVGTIIMHRLGKDEGQTISVNSAQAPKDARRAFEKGMEAINKKNPDEAQKNFEKAVEVYPKYSAAWFALGRLQEQRDHAEEAGQAYRQAIAAEPKLIPPYERLSLLALNASKWQELADWTDQLLRLNPLASAETFYFSSVAQFQLQHYDIAEKNAREAIRLDSANRIARTHYVLGLALAQKQNFTASAESLRHFLEVSPNIQDAEVIRKQLSQVEEAAKEEAPAPQK